MNIFEQLALYFSYPFVIYAFAVGILIALCSALFGVVLVLKRFSLIGDGLSHIAFGAMAVAAVVGLTDHMLIVLPVTVVAAVLLLRTGQNTRIKGDAAIAMVSVGALGIGYLLMSVFSPSANVAGDVCGTLFGSSAILSLGAAEVAVCGALSLCVVGIFLCLYRKIFAVPFDEDFSRATGVRASLYNLVIAVVIAVIIVLAMNLVGSLLISALVIFPALSAMRICRRFCDVVIAAACLSVGCAALGVLASILWPLPVGPTIVVADIVAFLICTVIGRVFCKR